MILAHIWGTLEELVGAAMTLSTFRSHLSSNVVKNQSTRGMSCATMRHLWAGVIVEERDRPEKQESATTLLHLQSQHMRSRTELKQGSRERTDMALGQQTVSQSRRTSSYSKSLGLCQCQLEDNRRESQLLELRGRGVWWCDCGRIAAGTRLPLSRV